jgi:four helix bundle protein
LKVQKFEDLIAWQKAQDLCLTVYKTFQDYKDYGFKDQIQRAALSITNNIAEGFGRGSKADFCRFLYYAQGSCSEVRSMLHLAIRLELLDKDQQTALIEVSYEVSRVVRGLIKSLE